MEISTAIYLSVFWIVPVAIAWYLVDLFAKRRMPAFGGIWLVLFLALMIRAVPAVASGYDPRFNNYDIDSYRIDTQSILAHQDIYTNPAAEWRHPYLPFQIYLIAAAGVCAELLGISFITAVKILPILADVGIAGLVYFGALSQWQDREKAFRLGLLYALNPVSTLIVSYHGQFDSIPIFLILAAWYVLQFKKSGLWASISAGLLLGMAILDKTWPIIFLPVFLLSSTDGWKKLALVAAAAIPPVLGIVVYSLLFSTLPIKILAATTSYGSVWAFWGWTYIAALFAGSVPPTMALAPVGRLLLLGSLFAFYLFVSRKQTSIAALLGVILVLFATTYGFSIQYLMWPLPFAFLAGERSWMRWYVGMASLWLAGYYFAWYGLALGLGVWVFWAPVVLWLFTVAWSIAHLGKTALPNLDRYLVLLALFALSLAIPLLIPGFIFTAYNARFSTFLLYEFSRAIGDGVFYPRWLPDFTFGYGYPYFNVYSPGAFFAAESLHFVGFDFVSAIKILFALSLMLSGLAMFGLVRRLTGRSEVAFVAGLAFVGISPLLIDLYSTTAFEASIAFALLPLVFWGSYEAIRNPRSLIIAGVALIAGIVILIHAGLALLCAPLLGVWVLFISVGELRKRTVGSPGSLLRAFGSVVLPFFFALGLGFGLAAIFIVPAVFEHQYLRPDSIWREYYGSASRLLDLFQSFLPLRGKTATPPLSMWTPPLVLPLVLALIYVFVSVRRNEIAGRFSPLYAGLVVATALLMFWFFIASGNWISVLAGAALPWKLLIVGSGIAAMLAAIGVMRAERRNSSRSSALAAVLLGALVVLGNQLYLFRETEVAEEPSAITVGELMNYQKETGAMASAPVWVTETPNWSDMADAWSAGLKIRTKIVTADYPQEILWVGVLPGGIGLHSNGERIAFTANADDLVVTLKTFYFPGWHAYLVKPWSTEILYELPVKVVENSGQMQVNVRRGSDQWLMFQFQDTPARIAGQWISLISALLALGMLIWGLRPQAPERPSGLSGSLYPLA